MIVSCHRINNIKELKRIPQNYGVEIDLNLFGNKLCLSHDPGKNGELFYKFLKYYNHRFIIINVKSEGLERRIFKLIKKFKIKNFFFLDSSFPFIYRLSKSLTKNFAIRISDFENINTAFNMKKKVNWIWLDCFKNYKITINQLRKLKKNNFKICLVSPDLHGRKFRNIDKQFLIKLKKNKISIDMICIKYKNLNDIKFLL